MASAEEIEMCFKLFDQGDTGSISAKDAATALRTLGKAPSGEDIEEYFGTGSVDFATFQAAYGSAETPDIDAVKEAFSTFDMHNSGYIPLGELQHLMKSLGESLPDEIIAQMSEAAEADQDNQVNWNVFVNRMFQDL
eukprot:m.352188 g.352188  ORF g.352188 m.352188 type:complete len:137 (+) comp16462_c0_seq1:400-810(+)